MPKPGAETKRGVPWVTLLLIGVNLAAAVFLMFNPDRIFDLGFQPAKPSILTAFVCLFLHENLFHLMANMIFLAGVGPLVELAVGRLQAAAIYVIGGLAGVGGYWLMCPDFHANTPIVGASGALAAWIGYAAVRYMSYRVPILPNVGVPVGVIGALWVILQLVGGIVAAMQEVQGGVAYWSHAAGFLAGLLMSLVFRTSKKMSLDLGHEVLDQMNQRGPAAVLRAAEQHLQRHPDDLRAMRQKAEALERMHEYEAAAQAWYDYQKKAPTGAEPEIIANLAGVNGLDLIPPMERAKLADQFRESHREEAILLLESLVSRPADDPLRPDAMLSLAMLLKAQDEARSKQLLQELQEKYTFHGATELARAKGLIE